MDSGTTVELLVEHVLAERFDVVAQFFQAAGGTLLALNWVPLSTDMERPEFRFLLDYWQTLKAGSGLPSADRLTPFDIRPALGHVVLVDALDDGRNGRFRLFGTRVAQRSGADLTGRRVDEFDGGSYLARFAQALFRAVFVRREPVFAAYQPSASVSATAWQWLILPLAGPDGAVVTRYLIGMMPAVARPPL